MDKQKIDLYLTTNAKYFEPSALPIIRQKLEKADDTTFLSVQACELKDPTTLLLISIFLGTLGIDRFMLGDTGMGILKLLTCGCCGILTIIDWFTISKKTKQKNLATLSMLI
jgi:TM2 domain-containing membrane protein YozV